MTITTTTTHIDGLWVEQRGSGPDVLLIGGLSDTVESWEPQLAGLSDRYRVTAYDNRGAGRSPMIPAGYTIAEMADDAAGVLRALGIESAHVAGFSGGSITAQELALRHPDLVRSLVLQSTWGHPDPWMATVGDVFTWLVERAPSDRAMLNAFLLWIYTPRAHCDGWVEAAIEELLAFEHPQSPEAFVQQLKTWTAHDALDRLPEIAAPTLVLAGGVDIFVRPALCREVADRIPGAEFRILEGEAHQPFQEVPDLWNAIVDEFWSAH